MKLGRTILAFLLAVATTYVLAVAFLTQQVIAKRAAIGANYTLDQQFTTFVDNLIGLMPAYGAVLTIALLLGFLIATVVKRILKPLARVAYPIGGAAAVYTAIYMIENIVAGGGVGALEGARGSMGMGLQSFAGLMGGVVFAVTRGRRA